MNIYKNIPVDGYQRVLEVINNGVGLHAIISVHNTNLGIALGGCRAMTYKNRDDMLFDVLRLSKGMTYKNAIAGLKLGGGKSVINLNGKPLTDDILKAFAEAMNYLNRDNIVYYTAGDIGIGPKQSAVMAKYSQYVNIANGRDSGYATAYGVMQSILAGLKFKDIEPKNATVAITGNGKVGKRLKAFLKDKVKQIIMFDINPIENECIHIDALYKYLNEIDVYAPCAIGAIVNTDTIRDMKRGLIIAGGANNQLYGKDILNQIRYKDIVYVPDYVANAGGVIIVSSNIAEDLDYEDPKVLPKLDNIFNTVTDILNISQMEDKHTANIADELAEKIWKK